MTTLTHSLRFHMAPRCAPFAALTPTQEARVLLWLCVAFFAGGAAVVLHALGAVTAFY